MIAKLFRHLFGEKWLRNIPEEHLENKFAMRIHRFIVNRLKQEGIESKYSNYYHLTLNADGRLYLRFHIPDNNAFIYEMTWDGYDSITINTNVRKLVDAQKNFFGDIQEQAVKNGWGFDAERNLAKKAQIYHDIISLLLTIHSETAWAISSNEAPKNASQVFMGRPAGAEFRTADTTRLLNAAPAQAGISAAPPKRTKFTRLELH